jgi:site-specific recombinase XerD
LYAFLRYLIEHDLADAGLLTRKIQLKVPDALPRAMDPDDVKCLLTVLDDVRNRAMILLLLRSGMRIECLQQLLGHSSIEMTLRYARLSDKTREHEYFKAMAIIEGEPIDEPDQRDHQLPPLF